MANSERNPIQQAIYNFFKWQFEVDPLSGLVESHNEAACKFWESVGKITDHEFIPCVAFRDYQKEQSEAELTTPKHGLPDTAITPPSPLHRG